VADDHQSEPPEARRAAYDRLAQRVVGLRLARVRYVVLGPDDEADEPSFDWDTEFDHLDWGLELVGENGRVVGFGWESAFEEFNLGIYEGGLGRTGEPVLDASRSPRWKPLVGRAVTAVDVRWIEDEATSVTYAAEDTGVALLGLGLLAGGAPTGTREVGSEGDSWVGAHTITVTSDENVARRLELWA